MKNKGTPLLIHVFFFCSVGQCRKTSILQSKNKMMTNKINKKIPATWKRSVVEQVRVGMPTCLSLPTLLGLSSCGPSIGSKSAAAEQARERLSSLPHIK